MEQAFNARRILLQTKIFDFCKDTSGQTEYSTDIGSGSLAEFVEALRPRNRSTLLRRLAANHEGPAQKHAFRPATVEHGDPTDENS